MTEFTLTIDGKGMAGEKYFPVINPAMGKAFEQAPDCTPAQLDDAMEAAKRAFPAWAADEDKRRELLKECAEKLRLSADRIGEVFTREHGRPLRTATGEVGWMAADLESFAKAPITRDVVEDDEKFRIEVQRKPYGVVAAIVPWNFPLSMAGWKIGQALIAGNTMVLKPSPFTPLATLMVGEILRDVLPPGVLNIVSGGNDLGAMMTTHPIPRKITFTGSIATGKKIAQAVAADLKGLTLEMGGNDAAIVLPDVDAAKIAKDLFWGAFFNSGQVCIAIKRLYVHESVYPTIVEALGELTRNTKMGDGFDPSSRLGPVQNEPQYEKIKMLVEDAKQSGGTMVAGGTARGGDGYFFEPTLVTDVSDGVKIVDEEQFGPVLPVIKYSKVDDAIARANASNYGLGGSIWTSDIDQGAALASQLECGVSWVNHHGVLDVGLHPLGGAKWSGIGYELGGKYGLDSYSRLQTVRVAKPVS